MYALSTDMNFSHTPAVSGIRELNAYEVDDVSGGNPVAVGVAVVGGVVGGATAGIAAFDKFGADGSISFTDGVAIAGATAFGTLTGSVGALKGAVGGIKAFRQLGRFFKKN